ncbi:hypothetical protein F3K20_12810 [Streptomyces scabiei]|uniref:hypothetical protein n=1 Tax=Streptomyces scabiei TaxID=1930 RepID=UPI000E69F512|nr:MULTISPECIES: hypothetical protein [Streptomyces]QTU45628.1 hypothetical protein F3K20_12810 [Streptomyces sp. LBUM 1482]
MTTTSTLTLGGLLAALIILIANLYPWWTGPRELKQLASFGKGFGAAACAAACPGGILGWLHSRSGTVSNGAGERAGQALTGADASSGLTSGQLVGLGATGAFVVVIAVTLTVLTYKAAGKKDKKRILGGAYVGSTLCLTAGMAGALAWLPTALNATGDGVRALFEGSGIL